MYLVGISVTNQESTVALLKDGQLVAASTEQQPEDDDGPIPDFPEKALRFCLKQENIGISAIDFFAFNEVEVFNWGRFFDTRVTSARHLLSTLRRVPKDIKEDFFYRVAVKKKFTQWLEDNYGDRVPPFHFCDRDLSQASATFYPSPYDSAAVLCIDKIQQGVTTSLWMGHGAEQEAHWKLFHPHSFAALFNAFAEYCGFSGPAGVKHVLNYACLGEPRFVQKIKDELIEIHADGSFALNEKLAADPEEAMDLLKDLFGEDVRKVDSPVTVREIDMATSLAAVIDEWAKVFAAHVRKHLGAKNLCLSGENLIGTFLCERLNKIGGFDDVWFVENTTFLAGLGAALSVWYGDLQQRRRVDSPTWKAPKQGRRISSTMIS